MLYDALFLSGDQWVAIDVYTSSPLVLLIHVSGVSILVCWDYSW